MEDSDVLDELDALVGQIAEERKVKAQKDACDNLIEWLVKHWAKLLDDNVQLPSYRDHPADQLLIICLDLFDKCKDAKTAAQQELPMKMTRAVLFGVTHNQKDPLLKFDKGVMQDCFTRAQKMLDDKKTQIDGASLLSEVLEVPGYRELADLKWLVDMVHQCLDMTFQLVSSSSFNTDGKKFAKSLLGIVQVIMQEFCRDSGIKCKCGHDAVDNFAQGFIRIGVQVQNHRDLDATVVLSYMRALTEFHATYTLDYRAFADKIRATVIEVIPLFWKAGGMDTLKKSFVQYLRLLVRARMLTDPHHLERFISLMKSDVAKGTKGSDEKRGLLTYGETITVELLVDLIHLRAKALPKQDAELCASSDTELPGAERPAKRKKPASFSEDLEWLIAPERMFPASNTGSHPRWYMQILFLHLVKFPEEIPEDVRKDLVRKFARALEQRSFDDLDMIWAMRCLDELVVVNQPDSKVNAQNDWVRIFASVLNIVSGRRSKRMESFEAVALNLLASLVFEGAVAAKDIETPANMGVIWKLLVTNWGQGMEAQGRASGSVSSSMHANQARENSARQAQDPLQVEIALTAFLVAVLNRISLSDDSISVEGITCCRRNLLNILRGKMEERGQNAAGHQNVTRLRLIARLVLAIVGSGQGQQRQAEASQQSFCAWYLRDLVSETRRTGCDIFKDLNGGHVDIYSLVRGRSGPDFRLLDEKAQLEYIGTRFRKIAPSGHFQDSRFERSLQSIAAVTGWCNQIVSAADPRHAESRWMVHLQTPHEEARQLSKMCLELLMRFDEQDIPSSAVPPQMILAVCLLDAATATVTVDKEFVTTIFDYLFKDDPSSLVSKMQRILSALRTARIVEKLAILESLEDVVDSLLHLLTRQSNLGQLGASCDKISDILVTLRRHCEQELRGRGPENQPGVAMDEDDDFGVKRNEQHAMLTCRRLRFRMWVKISAATNDTHEPSQEVIKDTFDKDHPVEEILVSLNAICNFGIPQAGTWSYETDVIELAAKSMQRQQREISRTDRELLYLKITSFLVRRLGSPGIEMSPGKKKVLLNCIQTHVLKWQVDQSYVESDFKRKSIAKANRVLRQMYVLCAAHVAPLAVSCYGTKESRSLGEFISASLIDCSLEVRFEAAKGLGSAIKAFAIGDNNVAIFKDVLEKVQLLDVMHKDLLLSAEANIRTKCFVFGEIAALGDEYADTNVQAYCVTMLCLIFANQENSSDVIAGILSNVARRQGFCDATELVRAHIFSILSEWWYTGQEDGTVCWTDFPIQLAGYTDKRVFVDKCVAPALVPEILLSLEGDARDKALERIGEGSSSQDSSANAVVTRFYADVYSRVVPIAKGSRDNVSDTLCASLNRAYAYIRNSCKDARHTTSHLQLTLRLLDVILRGNPTRWLPHDDSTHWSTPQIAEMVIEALKSIPGGKGDCELFFLGVAQKKRAALSGETQSMSMVGSIAAADEQAPTDFLPQVYLHLLRALKGHGGRKVTRQQKERVLEAVSAFVKCLGSLLRESVERFPWVLSHTISHLLTAISDADVTRQGCRILKTVIDGLIRAKKSRYILDALPDIICTLIPLAAHDDFTAEGDENLPLEIIETLVSDVADSAEDMQRLRGLPPFPQSPIFTRIRSKVGDVVSHDGQFQDKIDIFLQVFENLKEPVPFEVQRATLVHLHEQLREHFVKSSFSVLEPGSFRARLIDACIYKMLAWTKIADTYVEKDRQDIKSMIGKCLGQLGPTLSNALSLHTPIEKVVAAIRPGRSAKADDFFRRFRVEICVEIVQKLRLYLEDENVEVVEQAVKLLKGVFNLDEKNDILEALKTRHDANQEAGERGRGRKRVVRGGGFAARKFDDIASYLQPFLHAKSADSASSGLVPGALRRNKTAAPPSLDAERRRRLWSTRDDADRARSYESWLHDLSHWMCVSDKNFDLWPLCAQLCKLKTDFAELVFPSLLFSIFLSSFENENSSDVAEDLGEVLKEFIFCKENSSLKAMRLVLQGLDVLRLVNQTINKHYFTSKDDLAEMIRKWEYSYFFGVPYLDVAKAARRCGAHLSALMYLELHSKVWSSEPDSEEQGNRELLLAYRAVEEPDGLDAFNKLHDFRSRFIAWEHDGEFAKTIGVFDNVLHVEASSSGGAAAMESAMDLCLQRPKEHGMCAALHNIGFSQLSFMAAVSFAANKSQANYDEEALFESAWRAQAWQHECVLTRPTRLSAQAAYHANIFAALKTLAGVKREKTRTYQEVEEVVRQHMEAARSIALADFCNNHDSQSIKHGQSQLVRLLICEDVESFLKAVVETSKPALSPSSQGRSAFARAGRSDSASSTQAHLDKIRLSWHSRYRQVDNNFALCEPLISVHTILLGMSPVPALLDEHLCLAAKISMKQGNMSFARASMQKLQMFAASHGKGLGEPSAWWIREAKLLWRDDQVDKAADLMQTLDRHLRSGQRLSPQDRMLQSRALAMNAALSSRTESSVTVKEMLERCVQLRKQLSDDGQQRRHPTSSQYRTAAAKAQMKLAAFHDQMFTHIQSQQNENKEQEALLKKTRQPLQGQAAGRGGEKLHTSSLKHLDQGYARMRKQRADYLLAALEHYMQCIALDAGEGKCQGAVFRVLHLWFEILGESVDDDDKELRRAVSDLLRAKFETTEDLSAFTGVARQVLSRLDDNAVEAHTQGPIRVLLAKLLRQRPHDLLLPTFYIATVEGKTDAAQELIQDIRRALTDLVTQTQSLKDAYIELAKTEWCRALGHKKPCPKCAISRGEKCALAKFSLQPQKMSPLSQIHWNAGRSKVRVFTASGPADGIDEMCVASFGKEVEYPGGVTYPKKIECLATSGRKYTQIVKSEDPRGDVVLSQIFSQVNLHFARDTKCRQRQLELGTYAVVALGEKSCVLEFVDNATPLSTILGASTSKDQYTQSLHGRYASPGEWNYSTCFSKIKSSWDADKSQEAQLKVFNEVCRHCSPVFRHYFAESTRSATEWFELRLKYTRSVASSSMAGHIVGLGDRHCSNILIRESGTQRGSLVHIDLGIIFDQARHLPRPEKIPFRLTRDLIDGMGLAKTDGVMSRCAQESLRVMRDNRYALLSIVDVLLHDPLESWKVSDRKREQKRDTAEGDSGSNVDARIIRKTIKDKLEGWSRGELLSVQGQVKHLIREATSPDNLSQLFEGWGAWY